MNEPTPSNNRRLIQIAAGMAIVAAAAIAVVIVNRKPTDGPEPPPGVDPAHALTAEQANALMRKAQLANGYLENIDLNKADALYSEIIEQLPGEPLGIRNQAICRYLLLEQQKIDATDAQLALAKLNDIEPDEAATHWLLGKAATKAGMADAPAAVKHFQRAAELSPNEAVYWYEAYAAARLISDGDAQAKRFLEEAHRLVPDNLFVLGDWLLVQAQAKDATIADTLAGARETFAPLRDTVLKRHRVDLLKLLGAANDALAQGDWNGVVRNARLCLHATRPNDFTQGDRRALAPHVLEFVVHEFSAAFRERFADASPPIPLVDINFQQREFAMSGNTLDAVLVDFDLDATLELVALDSGQISIYKRSAPATWEQVASFKLDENYTGLLVADLDRDRNHQVTADEVGGETTSTSCFDADADIVAYGEAGVIFLRNSLGEGGARTLEVVKQDESVANVKQVETAVLVDFDHDSNLDVVCSTADGVKALLGQGEMSFVDVSQFSDLPQVDESTPITSLVAVDWDRDVDIDIVAIAANHQFGYLENLRHGNFRWQPFGDEYAKLAGCRSLAVVESDGNVSWDLLGAGTDGVALLQTETPTTGRVRFKADRELSNKAFTVLLAADMDNNGHQDAVVLNGRQLSLLRMQSNGEFAAEVAIEDAGQNAIDCDVGDIDNDGDLDLCVFGDRELALLVNDGGNANNWISIRAMGQVDNAGKANHHGIGSLLEVKAGTHYQAQVVSKPVTHFGLGEEPNAAIVRFLWTNGVPQDLLEPAANQVMCELMSLKGSCPYVYTWTGERFEFFTDCLWAAPIGLQLAEDVLAPTRSWEYLRIPGDRLREKDGCYSLQVTEELWEAGYFDLVDLIAVDHPADVEIFSNEKVGPAEISEFKLHTVRERRNPVSAVDQRGRDVSEQIRARDGNFLRAFDKTIAPGLAEDHFLELDLGDLESPEQITLFLTGWIYPTDTSLNVALSRHPQAGGPRPPSVHVPGDDGEWHEVQAYMGFPGGKTKTISVDLSKAFLTDDYRVRIATSAEIYWDEAFFTVDDEPAEVRIMPLELESAELHYRGFSRALPERPNAPETYNYADVQVTPKWPPMRGAFTRYGNVAELVNKADDRMAILGGGDEMTLRFQAPESSVPDGWVRDFIMHNVGWDKDADLNTIYGQSVEPLPYRDMTSYPYGPDAEFPATPAQQDYLQRYQTRFQPSQRFWRRIKDYSPRL